MLKAVYKCGSSTILENAHDVDYVYIYETREERMEAFKKYRRKEGIDPHWDSLDVLPRIFAGCPLYPYLKLVEGEEVEAIKNFNLLDHKEEYISLVRKHLEFLPREHKGWYKLYIGISMLDRGTMELSKEQIENAQKIHDDGLNCELYNYIIDYLEKVK